MLALTPALFVANHAFILSVIIVCGGFSAHLYTDIYNNFLEPDAGVIMYFSDNDTMTTEWNSTIQTVYTYTICIVAFIGWILVLLILFATIDSMEFFIEGKQEKDTRTKAFFFVKTILHHVGLYSQVILILKATKLKLQPPPHITANSYMSKLL